MVNKDYWDKICDHSSLQDFSKFLLGWNIVCRIQGVLAVQAG